jgi:hypothetical protein
MKRPSSRRALKLKTRAPKLKIRAKAKRQSAKRKSVNVFEILNLKTIKPVDKSVVAEMRASVSGLDLIYKEAHRIDKWPDHRFTTDEGRTFGLYQDGESILQRLHATPATINWVDTEGIERVKNIAGFIMEIGTKDPPLVFQEDLDLGLAWIEHHRQYSVALTDEECEILEDQLGISIQDDDSGEIAPD